MVRIAIDRGQVALSLEQTQLALLLTSPPTQANLTELERLLPTFEGYNKKAILAHLSKHYSHLGQLDKALEHQTAFLNLAQTPKDMIYVKADMLKTYRLQKDWGKAWKILQEILELKRLHGLDDNFVLGRIAFERACLHFDPAAGGYNLIEALDQYERACTLFERSRDRVDLFQTHEILLNHYSTQVNLPAFYKHWIKIHEIPICPLTQERLKAYKARLTCTQRVALTRIAMTHCISNMSAERLGLSLTVLTCAGLYLHQRLSGR